MLTDGDGTPLGIIVEVPANATAATLLEWLKTLSNYNFVWYAS